jgi:hypothetical protein
MGKIECAIRQAKYEDKTISKEIDCFPFLDNLLIIPMDNKGPDMKSVIDIRLSYKTDDIALEDVEKYNLLAQYMPMSFFDCFGFGNEFKHLFDERREATILSKKEISNIIRHEFTCDMIGPKRTYFEFTLSKMDIK